MDWRGKGMIIGGLAGAMLGMLVAWILLEDSGRPGESPTGAVRQPMKLKPTDLVRLITSVVMIVRQVADLRGQRS